MICFDVTGESDGDMEGIGRDKRERRRSLSLSLTTSTTSLTTRLLFCGVVPFYLFVQGNRTDIVS